MKKVYTFAFILIAALSTMVCSADSHDASETSNQLIDKSSPSTQVQSNIATTPPAPPTPPIDSSPKPCTQKDTTNWKIVSDTQLIDIALNDLESKEHLSRYGAVSEPTVGWWALRPSDSGGFGYYGLDNEEQARCTPHYILAAALVCHDIRWPVDDHLTSAISVFIDPETLEVVDTMIWPRRNPPTIMPKTNE